MIQYIIKALLKDDTIFINDLGTFTKTYQPARFDGDTMLPPQYVVTLTVKDDQPDSTEFINLVCREKQCRITEASAEINRWVDELKTAIENNKEVAFDNFGTFSLNNKEDITFVCDHIEELNREFEGMGIVKLGEEVQEVKEVNGVNGVNGVQEVNEEEERRLQEEAEQRLREAEEQERIAKEAEEKRLQEEAEQRLREAEEQERIAKEAEEKRLQEEAEQRLREAEEQERIAKEAEEKRLQEEAEQRLREAEEQERLAKEAEDTEKVNKEEEKEVMEEEEDDDDEKDDENDKSPKKHRSWWWFFVLLILIALGVSGYLFRQQLTDAFNKIKEKATAPKEAVVTEEPVTVAEDTATYEEETTVAEDTVVEPEVYTPEVVRNTASGNYPVIRYEPGHFYVIAGSLPNEQDAVRHIKQRNLDQYEPKIVMQPGANLRVCIGIFDTEEEAETFAKNINPKYWVLK